MATTLKHRQVTHYILAQIKTINPYVNSETDRRGSIYAYGFLASYLANIIAEDPRLLKQFDNHIKQQRGANK